MMLNWQTVAFAKNQFFHPNCLVDIGWPMQAVQRWENLGVIWSIPFPKWCPLLHCLQFNPPNVASKIICIFIPSPIPCSAIFKQYILSLSLYIYIYILQQIINPYKFPPLTYPSTNCQKKICQKKTSHHPSFNPHPPPSSASSLHECRRRCQALPPLPWWSLSRTSKPAKVIPWWSLSRTSKPAKLIMEQIWWPIVRHRYLSLFDGDP